MIGPSGSMFWKVTTYDFSVPSKTRLPERLPGEITSPSFSFIPSEFSLITKFNKKSSVLIWSEENEVEDDDLKISSVSKIPPFNREIHSS